jgi:diguanylate cyclase (GGDEF)-like protein
VTLAFGAFGAAVAAHAVTSVVGDVPQVAGLNLANLAAFGATGLMLVRAVRRDGRTWLPVALGMVLYSAGFVVYAELVAGNHVATPSAADPLWLALYPGAYATIVLLVLRSVERADTGLWLDGIVAALATTALGSAYVFQPVLAGATGGAATVATTLAYPLGDVVMLALVAAAAVLTGARPLRSWLLLGGGFAVFGVGDSVYVSLAVTGRYVPGHLLDVSWAAGLLVLAAAAWQPWAEDVVPAARGFRRLVLAVPSAVVALGLLVANHEAIGNVAVGFAAATLVCALMRMTYAVILEGRLEATRVQALTDELTGLGNRRLLLEHLDRVAAEATPEAPSALVLFDLNGFKHYNDTWGHLEGDRLLGELARRLEREVGAAGRAYRLGGDEFCALLTGDPRSLDAVLPRLEQALSEPHDVAAVGCSYGVALLPHEARTASAALALADRRMYERKEVERRSTRRQMRDLLLAVVEEQRPDLHQHATAVGHLSRTVALRLGLAPKEVDLVALAAELHDIGKIAIPDAVLRKPGPLDDEEWQLMRTHPAVGERVLLSVPTLQPMARIVRATHERWDGAGYPDGLAGEAIPLAARIVAACDALDASVSDRSYGPAKTLDEAVDELERNAGTQFDPMVVQALVEVVTAEPAVSRPALAPRRPTFEPRLSTIASLRGLLEVTRLVRRAGSLASVLEALATTVGDSLGLGIVVVNLRRPGADVFDVVTVRGSDEVREGLLGTSNDWSEWEPLLDERFHRRGAYHIRAGEYDWTTLEGRRVVVGAPQGDDPWLWHPEDELFVPFYGSDGLLLGIFSVGEPRNGRRPSDEELDVLVAMAEHAAVAVESLQTVHGERPQLVPVRDVR